MEVVNVELQQFCAGSDIPMGGNYNGNSEVLSLDDEVDLWDTLK